MRTIILTNQQWSWLKAELLFPLYDPETIEEKQMRESVYTACQVASLSQVRKNE